MAVFDATKPLRSEQVGTRAPREHSLLRSRKRPQLAQSGRIRLRDKLGDLGPEEPAAFAPPSLLSRHTAYGQLRSLKPARRNVSDRSAADGRARSDFKPRHDRDASLRTPAFDLKQSAAGTARRERKPTDARRAGERSGGGSQEGVPHPDQVSFLAVRTASAMRSAWA